MPTGYTSEVHDGKTVALADYLRTCVRAFILDLKDEPFDAPIPERSTYKDEVVANYERQEREALDAIYKLEGMTDAECEALAQAEYDETLARMTGYNDKKKVVEARYRAVLAQLNAWDAPPPLHGVYNFMREQLVKSIEFDCTPFTLPKPPLPGREWRASQMDGAQRAHASASAELVKQREARVRGNAFMETLHAELRRLDQTQAAPDPDKVAPE